MTELDIEPITQILLMACNEIVLVPIIILGFLAIDRKIFGHATILLMFIMILNAFLKSIFQVPLSEHLNIDGYAFPSGHMSSAFTFYGWLFLFRQLQGAPLSGPFDGLLGRAPPCSPILSFKILHVGHTESLCMCGQQRGKNAIFVVVNPKGI